MNRHQLINGLHARIKPRTYLETGVNRGESMTLSRVPSIGIDPEFNVTKEIRADVYLARTTSDEFFSRKAPLAHFHKPVVDFAFIDGMHLSEYALRDYLAVERFTEPTSVVLFDDMLPRNVTEAARRRVSKFWTGDVYKAAQALRTYCPELVVIEIDTTPTGTLLVLLPDASRGGVLPEYDEWMEIAMAPDPQDVPEATLTRAHAVAPEALLASSGWNTLRALRGRTDPGTRDLVRAAFSDLVRP